MDKVYVVSSGKGLYDNNVAIVIGVFNDKKLAEDCQKNYELAIETLRNRYTDEQREQYYREIDYYCSEYEKFENWPKDVQEYWNWHYEDKVLSYWTKATIEEYPINETVFNLPKYVQN